MAPKFRTFFESLPREEGALRRTLAAELAVAPRIVGDLLPTLVRARLRGSPSLLALALENARRSPHGLALELDGERVTWGELDVRTSQVARVLAGHGVSKGDVVALVGRNAPSYVALILGATRVGATAALVNHHLVGKPLAHALVQSRARLFVVERELLAKVSEVELPAGSRVVAYGASDAPFEEAMRGVGTRPFLPVPVGEDDDFVFIYTSGTTGFPKPCRVTHGKALGAGAAAGHVLFGLRSGDKIYSPLPLYHASALLLGVGSAIACGVPLALRRDFSASAFLPDAIRYEATAMLYIGEICRYLLATPPSADDKRHRIRVAAGNGLRADVWAAFEERFGIHDIHEFYGATEAPGGLVNLGGVRGSVGRLPFDGFGFVKLAKLDVETEEHVRDADGFVVPAGEDEPGELLIRLVDRMPIAGLRFRGYTDAKATDAKVLTDVFRRGDRWFRSGDLLKRDSLGFYQFVDRIGDTYRCKGENVSTNEVADVLAQAPGIAEVTVVGVRVPSLEGQFGLAALVVEGAFDPVAFRETAEELPPYARPRFVRLLERLEVTGTFKHQKTTLRRQGADPTGIADPLFVLDERVGAYVPLDAEGFRAIVEGRTRI